MYGTGTDAVLEGLAGYAAMSEPIVLKALVRP